MVRDSKAKAKLTGRKKAAALMIVLGPDIAADVYRCLSDEEIEQITLEVANIGTVPQEVMSQVIARWYLNRPRNSRKSPWTRQGDGNRRTPAGDVAGHAV